MEFTERELGILIDLVMEEYNISAEGEEYQLVLEKLLKKLGVPIELIEEMKPFTRGDN